MPPGPWLTQLSLSRYWLEQTKRDLGDHYAGHRALINCAEKVAALILESGVEELTVKPCSGACREAIELYFSTPSERWRAPVTR
jgi:hypothetical protein